MRRILAILLFALALAPGLASAAQPNTQLSVGQDGVFTAKNLVVYQKSGSALYCRAVWGQAFVRITVMVVADGSASTTNLVKAHGGAATLDEVQTGDLIDVVGRLQTGADTLFVNAERVDDHSLNQEQKTLSGIITSVSGGSFVLSGTKLRTVTVSVGTSTITKGARTITSAELAKGDKVLSVSGLYDYASNTVSAASVTIWQDPSVFVARNFEGKVTAITGTNLPTTVTLSTAKADYTVYLGTDAKVLTKGGVATELSRFAVGDKVRVFGAIRKDNLANLDATSIRDLNF